MPRSSSAARLASWQKPASPETSAGLAPEVAADGLDEGDEGAVVGRVGVRRWATITWCAASTAIWPL